jgi:hypothetical protein
MKIGIIGSGAVGQALAKGFAKEGHEVKLGTRSPNKPELDKFKTENPSITIASFRDTALFGDLIVLATNGHGTEEAIQLAGKENFNSKIVIDTTNPIEAAPPVNGVLKYFTNINESLMEKIQQWLPQAKLVKAFSCVGNAYMYKPNFAGGPPTMFIAGNDTGAKEKVTEILQLFGWEVEDMGKVEAARAIEPLAILWCLPGFTQNRWSHAFKLLKA